MSSGQRLILFGAGASAGSERVIPSRPPVGAELFDRLASAYPNAWGRISPASRSDFVPNFELGMKKIWDSGSHDGAVLLRSMAHFFAQFRADHGNTYQRLLEHLEARGALHGTHFSTLNYECVLETAARNYGFLEVCYGTQDATVPGKLSVWKIHGSCNFLPTSISAGANVVSYGPAQVSWDGDVRSVDPVHVGPFVEASAFYPAMAVFMAGKPVHSSPAVIATLQEWWKAAVEQARAIGVVGVNPNPEDSHLWKPLAEAPGRIVVVGDEVRYREWGAHFREGRPLEIVGRRFADCLDELARALARKD